MASAKRKRDSENGEKRRKIWGNDICYSSVDLVGNESGSFRNDIIATVAVSGLSVHACDQIRLQVLSIGAIDCSPCPHGELKFACDACGVL